MKLKFLSIPLIASSCITLTSLADPSTSSLSDPPTVLTDIVPGAGYSSDTQQLSKDVCFNTEVTGTTREENLISLSSATSFSDLERVFGESVGGKFSVGMFSVGAQSSYFRSIRNTSYSLSLNYYQQFFNTTTMRVVGSGRDVLTPHGRDIYDRLYPLFGIRCGDNYINTFRKGAQLLMSLNIQFRSRLDKEHFESSSGESFLGIVESARRIQQISTLNQINGFVWIQAYQRGGDPTRLSQILERDRDGNYYAIVCSLQNMNACVSVATSLSNYATNSFRGQISFEPEYGLVPLDLGFATYQSVRYVGLTPPPSLVTPQVEADRLYLADSLLANQYYSQNFDQLINAYPVSWDRNSNLYRHSENFLQNARNNIAIITRPELPQQGVLGCYTTPDECSAIRQTIQARLMSILPSQLTYLKDIEQVVRFTTPNNWGSWYASGDNYARTPLTGSVFRNGRMQVTPSSIAQVSLFEPNNNNWTGESQSTGERNYTGRLCRGTSCQNVAVTTSRNPFYFEPY